MKIKKVNEIKTGMEKLNRIDKLEKDLTEIVGDDFAYDIIHNLNKLEDSISDAVMDDDDIEEFGKSLEIHKLIIEYLK